MLLITHRRYIEAGGWLKVERRLADCGGETLEEAHPERRRRDYRLVGGIREPCVRPQPPTALATSEQ